MKLHANSEHWVSSPSWILDKVGVVNLFEKTEHILCRIVRQPYRLLVSNTECSIFARVDIALMSSAGPFEGPGLCMLLGHHTFCISPWGPDEMARKKSSWTFCLTVFEVHPTEVKVVDLLEICLWDAIMVNVKCSSIGERKKGRW